MPRTLFPTRIAATTAGWLAEVEVARKRGTLAASLALTPSISPMNHSLSRIFRLAAVAGLVVATAPTPFVPGVTYRLRMTTRLPDFLGRGGGGGAGGPLILARVTSVGDKARFEFQAVEPMRPGINLNDYVLLADSGKFITVSPDSQTYREGSVVLVGGGGIGSLASSMGGRGGGGGGGRGRGNADAAAGSGILEGYQVRDVRIDVKDLGAGEQIDGRATQHYMVNAEYTVLINGQPSPLKMLFEVISRSPTTTISLWTISSSKSKAIS
jgi:hypothetical protein